jgi:hypothetical protein
MPRRTERNQRMKRLADEAVDDELKQLKAKRERLRNLAVRLAAWQETTSQLRDLADQMERECGVNRQWIIKTLGVTSREAAVIWPAKNRTTKQGGKPETVTANPGNDQQAMVSPVPYPSSESARR